MREKCLPTEHTLLIICFLIHDREKLLVYDFCCPQQQNCNDITPYYKASYDTASENVKKKKKKKKKK